MNTSLILTNLGLSKDNNVIGLIKENKPLKFLISSDRMESFYKLLTLKNEDFSIQDRRRVISAFSALFKNPRFNFYRNFMGKLVSKSSSPLAMMYAPDYSLQVGADIPVLRQHILKAAMHLQQNPSYHMKILGQSNSVYEVTLQPSTDGSLLNIELNMHMPESEVTVIESEDYSKQGRSDLINMAHKVNSGKPLDDSENRLYDAITRQKLNRFEHYTTVNPIDFDAPSFPPDVLEIMRRYDETFDQTIGAQTKSIIMENTSLFVSRLIATLGAEPDILFQLLGSKYIINDYSKLAPLVNHVMSQMSIINSQFFK